MKMRYYFCCSVLILASGAFCLAQDVGVSLAGFGKSPQQRIEVAKQLGGKWYRPAPVLLGAVTPACDDCEPAKAAGMKIALVVRNSASVGQPSAAVTEVETFQQKLKSLLERYKPELLLIEEEPDNQKASFKGSLDEYVAELKAACDTSRSLGIKCANGGVSSWGTAAAAIDQRWKTDRIDAAKLANTIEFTRASGHEPLNIVVKKVGEGKNDLDAVVETAEKYLHKNRAEIDRARAFLGAADAAGADYLSFHWFELQPDVLPKISDILHELAKRPLMTDLVGQRSERVFETGEKIRVLLESSTRPVIWAGADGKDGVIGLVDGKGKLRPTAAAFQRAVQSGK